MRRALALALLAVVAGAGDGSWTGKVVGIHDGDTISVMHDGKAVHVRLDGIDCPELGQAYGRQARERVSELAFGRMVTVRTPGADRFGRVLGQVFLPDGRNLNRELVREGLAWWYRRYAPRNTALADLEEQARERRLGLWQGEEPEPPWLFRKQRRRRD